MRALRVIVAVLAAVVGTVVLAPAASAASAVSAPVTTARIGGVEYAAELTRGKFGGAATGPLPGAWLATVVHEPLRPGRAVPITGGSFTLHGRGQEIGGEFVRGTVAPLDPPSRCGNERFDVRGTLALDDGGRGAFRVTLTHLRLSSRSGCRTYGAVVDGTLTVPSGSSSSV